MVSQTLSIPTPQNGVEGQKIEKLVMPAMARKAGGSWRAELNPGGTTTPIPPISEAEERSSEDESDSEYWDSNEPECPEYMFYHPRGRNCVPIFCPKVYARNFPRRDPVTGECSMYCMESI
ncbi:unnamed protein product [Orchesella dallaii]